MGCYTLSPPIPNSHRNWVVNLIVFLPFVECRAVEDAKDLVDLEGDDGSQHDVEQALEDHEDRVNDGHVLERSDELSNHNDGRHEADEWHVEGGEIDLNLISDTFYVRGFVLQITYHSW